MMAAAADEVRAAVADTRAAGTARYEYVRFVDFEQMGAELRGIFDAGRTPSDGSLRGDLERAGTELFEGALRRAGRWLVRASRDPELFTTRGVLDLRARRYVAEKGELATLVEPGGIRERSPLDVWDPPDRPPPGADGSVLWLVDALAGATTADASVPQETVRGVSCRVVDVRCDLSLAARATPGDVPAPSAADLDDLLALPFRVWIDERRLRRVRYVDPEVSTYTLELFDHGAPIDPAVWQRPPARA